MRDNKINKTWNTKARQNYDLKLESDKGTHAGHLQKFYTDRTMEVLYHAGLPKGALKHDLYV